MILLVVRVRSNTALGTPTTIVIKIKYKTNRVDDLILATTITAYNKITLNCAFIGKL